MTSLPPKISILIPAYNHAAYLPACLDSVLSESYPHKEVVIINDGSTDDSHKVISEWVAQHQQLLPITYIQRDNQGIAKTLNQLITLATGDYLRFLASDDLLIDGGLQQLVSQLQQHPTKKAIFADSEVIDSRGQLLHRSMLEKNGACKFKFSTDKNLAIEIISNWAVSGPVILLRKDIFQEIGLYNEQLVIEDWDLYLRIIAKNYLLFTDYKVAQYRIHDSNTSRTKIIARRIHNLWHQQTVATNNMPLFHGKLRQLLQAEHAHLNAKISFLRKNFYAVTKHLLCYSYYRLRAYFSVNSLKEL